MLLRSRHRRAGRGRVPAAAPDLLRGRRLRRGRERLGRAVPGARELRLHARRRGHRLPRRVGQREPAVLGGRAAVPRRRARTRSGCCACATSPPGTRSRTTTARAASCSAPTASRSCAGSSTTRSTSRLAARLHVELARLHHARGAEEILTFHWDDHTWRRGDDFDAYVARLERTSYERTAYSAHQMGSCRMGADAATSVADGHGRAARHRRGLDRRCLGAADGARASTRC